MEHEILKVVLQDQSISKYIKAGFDGIHRKGLLDADPKRVRRVIRFVMEKT